MEANTVYTEKGWISQGCGIYSKDDKEPLWTRVARVSTEVPESEMIGVIELLRAAPETARKLAEALARIAELEIAAKGALSALSQNAIMVSDVNAAKKWLLNVVQLTDRET